MKLVLSLAISLSCVAAQALPECAQEFACLAVFEPVCGSNGVTYSNNCMLRKAQCDDKTITKRSDGACTPSDKPITVAPTTAPAPGTTPSTAPSAPGVTTAAPANGATTTQPPATTTTTPSTTQPTTPSPSPPAGSAGSAGSASAGKDSDASPSAGTTITPSLTTKAPVPSPPKSDTAPLFAVGLSALAAAILAAVL